jgi:hypothetical protein
MDGFGMPLAMHCKVTGLCFTTVLSERPDDLIVGGTRWKEGKKRVKTSMGGGPPLKTVYKGPETSKLRKRKILR